MGTCDSGSAPQYCWIPAAMFDGDYAGDSWTVTADPDDATPVNDDLPTDFGDYDSLFEYWYNELDGEEDIQTSIDLMLEQIQDDEPVEEGASKLAAGVLAAAVALAYL